MTTEDWLEILRRHALDTVCGAFAYGEGEELHKKGLGLRRRTRIHLADPEGRIHTLYLKRYRSLRPFWAQILSWFRAPSSEARHECENILAMRRAGIPTMDALIWGEERSAEGEWLSYIVVTPVPGDALERTFDGLPGIASWEDMESFTRSLARFVRSFHGSGYVHRDLYASHIFWSRDPQAPDFHLIDLARAFAPRIRALRWRVKDLAQLKYSMPETWQRNSWGLFLDEYLPKSGQRKRRGFENSVERKVRFIRRQVERRASCGAAKEEGSRCQKKKA